MPLKIVRIKFALIIIFFLFLISLMGIKSYQGSIFCYIVFNIVWLTLLYSAFCCSCSYIIFYIKIMLFLGFWLKLIAHVVFTIPLVEPTGYWASQIISSSHWDHVLLISSVAALGVLSANLIHYIVLKKYHVTKREGMVPLWYKNHNNMIWYSIFFLALVVNLLNAYYHISITGLKPGVILPFHLNALILWVMAIAPPLFMSIFLEWELKLKHKDMKFYMLYIVLAFITSLSTLSRSVYIFWTIPILLVLFTGLQGSLKQFFVLKNLKYIISYCSLFFISLVLICNLRIHYYASSVVPPKHTFLTNKITGEPSPSIPNIEKSLNDRKTAGDSSWLNFLTINKINVIELKKLPIGRWVGLEAIMATSSFPQASWNFFKKSLLEKPSVGEVGSYTNKVLCINKYDVSDNKMFSSLPGLIGILNYSNSYYLVFAGMFIVCVLLCLLEWRVFCAFNNKFLLSQQGLILSYWCVSGLNIPYLGIINMLECLFVLVLIIVINTGYTWCMKLKI